MVVAEFERDAILIATFDFSYVGFAAIWGFVFFDEIPATRVSIGIVLIVSAGIIAARQQPSDD